LRVLETGRVNAQKPGFFKKPGFFRLPPQ
jgi:hypothetical protein